MKKEPAGAGQPPAPAKSGFLFSILAWLAAASLVGLAVYLGWQLRPAAARPDASAAAQEILAQPTGASSATAELPGFVAVSNLQSVSRKPLIHTTIPNRPAADVVTYTVSMGESLFEIAASHDIKPDTVLWANYDVLNDNPDMISVGMQLKIPPVNGVYYQVQEGDTIEGVAAKFEVTLQDILSWAPNHLDLTEPVVKPGDYLMIPGGHREYRQWIIPVIARGHAGVSRSVYGAGACEGGYDGAYGSGAFIWPAGNHSISGNDYFAGHLGIDIAAGEGAPIYAADAGVIVFAGWATGGYGNMVMIDHGNGYQTLYAHLSAANVGCGSSVGQGGTIGYAGSTGNSTGAHLHFEVRFQGGFVSPWYVLPAP